MNTANILFNDSNLYFPNAEILQSRIWFVNPMDIDIFVKKSFGVAEQNVLIYGAYIQAFNSNHVIDDMFIVYQIQLHNNQPIINTEGKITFNLKKQWFFSGSTLNKIIQGIPIISIILLSVITFFMPTSIAKIFRYISLIGTSIVILFYGWKMIKIMYKLLTNKGIDYHGITVYYENKNDMFKINDAYIQTLKVLDEIEISEVIVVDGIFYLKQEIRKVSLRQTIKNIFKNGNTDDTIIIPKIQKTIDFLLTISFIWSYIHPTDAIQQN